MEKQTWAIFSEDGYTEEGEVGVGGNVGASAAAIASHCRL